MDGTCNNIMRAFNCVLNLRTSLLRDFVVVVLLLLGLIILDIAKTESNNCFSANQKSDSDLYV